MYVYVYIDDIVSLHCHTLNDLSFVSSAVTAGVRPLTALSALLEYMPSGHYVWRQCQWMLLLPVNTHFQLTRNHICQLIANFD